MGTPFVLFSTKKLPNHMGEKVTSRNVAFVDPRQGQLVASQRLNSFRERRRSASRARYVSAVCSSVGICVRVGTVGGSLFV